MKAKVSYIMPPLPLKGFFTMDTVPRQNVNTVVRKTFTHFACLLKNLHLSPEIALGNLFMFSSGR
jgi:hypothetical protein